MKFLPLAGGHGARGSKIVADSVNRLLRPVSYAIGSIMALGALFGALSSMHSAVAARTVEIATLRAIGFTSSAVAISV